MAHGFINYRAIILVGVVVLSGFLVLSFQSFLFDQSNDVKPGVFIVTDKSTYIVGENVTITLVNNFDHSISIISYGIAMPFPFQLINIETNEVIYLYPPPDSGVVYTPIERRFVIESKTSVVFIWNQQDWRGYLHNLYEYNESFQIPPGTYKLKLKWHDDLKGTFNITYSEPFKIIKQ